MVQNIREVEKSLGTKIKQPIIKNEKWVPRRIIAKESLKKNDD